ncbi:DNA topoisomerase 3-alpha [Acipenser ruthenus]|uniref:DNA topoisomerase n=1 Tax=Acipenser ruthenus TaxID=7906 RepID=A0A444UBG9_ACIRT|nr:DNA topoisomerase 3-alpha [Acipenser ruthenus]
MRNACQNLADQNVSDVRQELDLRIGVFKQQLDEFIVRHFLACCSQDAQGRETTVDIDIAQERFATYGLMIIARNYLDVYPYDMWYAKVIPVYERGSRLQPTTIEMLDGETSPPQLFTEADLISLMEKHGIG